MMSPGMMTMFSVGSVALMMVLTLTEAMLNWPVGSVLALGSGMAPHLRSRVMLMGLPASGRRPPASERTSNRVLRPSSWRMPGLLTAPRMETGWLRNSAMADDDLRIFQDVTELIRHLLLRLSGGEAGGMNAAREGQAEVAAHVDAEGFVSEFVVEIRDDEA